MTIHIENESEESLEFNYQEIIQKVVEECLDFEECPYEAEVNILLTNNEEIHQINREYRDIDSPTDVLSFPNIDYECPGNFSNLEESTEAYFNPDTGELFLGDIVISVEKAVSQAQEYGHSLEREIAFLVAHSMFHLFGYDHMIEEERTLMEDKQRKVLNNLNILR